MNKKLSFPKSLKEALKWSETDINLEYIEIGRSGVIANVSKNEDFGVRINFIAERLKNSRFVDRKLLHILEKKVVSMPPEVLFSALSENNYMEEERISIFVTVNFNPIFLFLCRLTLGRNRLKRQKDNYLLRQMFVSGGELKLSSDNKFKDRTEKSENAPTFLDRIYSDAIKDGQLTLSDLRSMDESLWRGLRNWAHAGNHDLDDIIPRGKANPGRAVQPIGFDPATLDPGNARDALILRGLKARENSRATSAAYRKRRASIKP